MEIHIEDFTYQKYVLNLYYDRYDDPGYYRIKCNRQLCLESELSVFKKLGYNYYQYGTLGDNDDNTVIRQFCVGYYIPTIYNIYGDSARWMPVISQDISEMQKDVNWEFHNKYTDIMRKIRNNRMWNIIITLNSYGGRNNPGQCIPIEIGHMIYEFWRE